jgi:hypothetical protein
MRVQSNRDNIVPAPVIRRNPIHRIARFELSVVILPVYRLHH